MLIEDFVDCHFSLICEDESPEEIGELLITMWRECKDGNYQLVQNVIQREREKHDSISRSQGIEGGDIIDEGDEEAADGDMELALAEAVAEVDDTPLIDEDGFQTVVRGKKSKKGKNR